MKDSELQALRLLREIAGGAAHDLNNILGGIVGYMSLLKAKAVAGDGVMPVAELVEQAGDRAADVVARLLAFSSSGTPRVEPCGLDPLLDQIVPELLARHRGLSVERESAPDFPALEVDVELFRHLLVNLLCQAPPPSGEPRRLLLKPEKPSPADLSLKDLQSKRRYAGLNLSLLEGPDTPCPNLAKVSTSRAFTAGLGPALCTVILEMLGGFARHHDGGGKLLDVSLFFPCAEARPETAAQGLVMVVDDEPIMLRMIKDCFDLLGYDGVFFSSGKAAVEFFQQRHADIRLVVLDLYMPEMSGMEVLAAMQTVKPDVQVLIASGYTRLLEKELREQRGVREFLAKPFKIKDLHAKLQKLIGA